MKRRDIAHGDGDVSNGLEESSNPSNEDENSDEEESDDFYGGFSDDSFDSNDCEEDFEEREYEVEEHQYVVPDTADIINIRLVVTKEEEFQTWMQSIHVTSSYGNKVIGKAHGRYIIRDYIRADFWRVMEEPSQDMAVMAFDIFDRYGCLKKEYQEHRVRKGTGVWGDELDSGKLLLVEAISVDLEWRRKGLGTAMAKALIKKAKARKGRIHFTIAIPGTLNPICDLEQWHLSSKQEKEALHAKHLDIAVSFWRFLGFRRIGASACFGLPTDLTHKAHEISIINDYDPPEEKDDAEVEDDAEEKDNDTEEKDDLDDAVSTNDTRAMSRDDIEANVESL